MAGLTTLMPSGLLNVSREIAHMQEIIHNVPEVISVSSDTTNDIPSLVYVVFLVVLTGSDSPNIYDGPFRGRCTGTLLRPNLVLTTRTCVVDVEGLLVHHTLIKIFTQTGIKNVASRVIPYPKNKMDIALILCKDNFNISEFPKIGNVDTTISPPCYMASYGVGRHPLNEEWENFKIVLVPQSELLQANCSRSLAHNKKGNMCFLFKYLKPCRGDAGCPLVCRWTVVAVFTPKNFYTRSMCAETYFTTFTSLNSISDWIIEAENSLDSAVVIWFTKPWFILLLSFTVLAIIAGIYYGLMSFIENRGSVTYE